MDLWKVEIQKAIEERMLPAFSDSIVAQMKRFFGVEDVSSEKVDVRVITVHFPPAAAPTLVEDFVERLGGGKEGRYWRVEEGKVLLHIDLWKVNRNFPSYLVFLDEVEVVWWGVMKKDGKVVKPPVISLVCFGTSVVTDGLLCVSGLKLREGKRWGVLFKEREKDDPVPLKYVLDRLAEGVVLLALFNPYCGDLGKWLFAVFKRLKSNLTSFTSTFPLEGMQVQNVGIVAVPTPTMWRLEWLGCTSKVDDGKQSEVIFAKVGVPMYASATPSPHPTSISLSGWFYLTVCLFFKERVAFSNLEKVRITPEVQLTLMQENEGGGNEVTYRSSTKTFEFTHLVSPAQLIKVVDVKRMLQQLVRDGGNDDAKS